LEVLYHVTETTEKSQNEEKSTKPWRMEKEVSNNNENGTRSTTIEDNNKEQRLGKIQLRDQIGEY
jgi:hypothetical protein